MKSPQCSILNASFVDTHWLVDLQSNQLDQIQNMGAQCGFLITQLNIDTMYMIYYLKRVARYYYQVLYCMDDIILKTLGPWDGDEINKKKDPE